MKKALYYLIFVCTLIQIAGQAQNKNGIVVQPLDIESSFIPCGWMGDCQQAEKYVKYIPDSGDSAYSAPTCIKISFTPGPMRWGGVYWLNSDCNWGDEKGFDLSTKGFTRISFWARGEKGGESVQFKAGGVNKKQFKDSFNFEPKLTVRLTKGWKQYILDLSGKDLSSVIGGFCWVTNSSVTFYLDDIFFE